MAKRKVKPENSGGSVSYYSVDIRSPTNPDQEPYTAEANDIFEELELTYAEANIMKELWRTAAARKGKLKANHDVMRGADKVVFFADRNHVQKELNGS